MRFCSLGFLLTLSLFGLFVQVVIYLIPGRGSAISERMHEEKMNELSSSQRVLVHAPPPIVGGQSFVITHDFPIENRLERPIRFTDVKPSCGCSRAELQATALGPGEKTTLHVEVSLGRQGGRRRVSCVLENDVGKPWVCILDAKGYPFLQFEKDLNHVSFGSLESGEGATKSVEVYTHAPLGHIPPVLSAVKAQSKDVGVSVLDHGNVTIQDPLSSLNRNL